MTTNEEMFMIANDGGVELPQTDTVRATLNQTSRFLTKINGAQK